MRLAAALALLAALLLAPAHARAQSAGAVEIRGRVEHGARAPSFNPTEARVTLNVLDGVTAVSQETASPDAAGAFAFRAVPAEGRTFFFSVEYQGAAYSAVRAADELAEPVVVTVFDSTHDSSVIAVQSHTVVVAGAVPDEGFVEILERAIVRNDSGLTLAPDPDAEGPAMLSFLRFALPPGAYNLDVRSNLTGGQVLEVDKGFALTSPVPPTAQGETHRFEFVYRLDYDEPSLDLSRVMRFGAESLRFVAPVDVAAPASPRLADLGATDFNGRLLRLLEGQDVEPGEVVGMTVSGLPRPSPLDALRESAGEWYVRYGAPAAVAVAALALLPLAFRRRSAPAASRGQLLAQARALRAAYDGGAISRAAYDSRTRALRDALVRLEIRERLASADGEQGNGAA